MEMRHGLGVVALSMAAAVTALAVSAPPAAALTAVDLCGGDTACLDELPVANDPLVQAQFDTQTPPTQVPVLNPTASGGASTVGTSSASTMNAAAFPSGYVTRTQVTTTTYPDKDAGQLAIYFGNATSPSGYCSGSLIGAHLVGTAGHCVYQSSRGWATRIDFIPGQINSTTGYLGGSHPYGTCYGDLFMTVKGWKDSGKDTYDYGAVRLGSCSVGDRDVGNRAGYAGFHSSSNESIAGLGVNLHGYPSGAPLYKTPGTMWKGVNGGIYNVQTHLFYYRIQTADGDSGGPVWRSRSDCGPGFCLFGVHTAATVDTSETVARRITDGMFNNWKNWRSQ